MPETRITDDGEDVVYKMPPWVADELASLMIHSATHWIDGKPRPVEKHDRGWLHDAQSLMDRADDLREVSQ